ncbi:MAG TPA: Xaa-Pro peptidase family protein [Candidatus Binatia bacterium]|nr:Xaa-Pro peptidase family protein [Candidatus Binatia bacterium]
MASITPNTMRRRIHRTQDTLRALGLDGMVVIKPEHVRYLAGVWGYSTRTEYAMPRRLIALIVPAKGDCTLIVPKIERFFVQRQTWIGDLRYHVEWGTPSETFGGLALISAVLKEKSLCGRRLGVETGFVSARFLDMLKTELADCEFVEAATVIEIQRMIKSPEEIEILRISGAMCVREFEAEARAVRAGAREFELAAIGREEGTRAYAEHTMADSETHALVDPIVDGLQIVTSGERLDMVHALASTRVLTSNDMVLLDFCRYPQFLGYRIGFSRMVSLRQPTKRETEMMDLTMEAFRLSLSVLRPGIPAEEPDLIARAFLDRHGLGETFVHRTGRGVGLEGVERPEIGAGDKTPLQPGMVVTVEPSIYFPHFAVHVEDTFLITKDGYEVLTPCSRELRVVTT